MNRFWIFPLVMGIVGGFFAVVCTVEAWTATLWMSGRGAAASDMSDALMLGGPIGAPVGVLVGIGAAWLELLRRGAQDRSGFQGARRLGRNLLWTGIYAVLLGAVNIAVITFLVRESASPAFVRFWFPGLLFPLFGALHFAAIVWAIARTVGSEDVLTPRVVGAKLRRSARLTG